MPELVADCPRCGAKKHTFTVVNFHYIYTSYRWKKHYESYCICKHCMTGTIFLLEQKYIEDKRIFEDEERLLEYKGSINHIMDIDGFVNTRSLGARSAPDHIPDDIEKIFSEGAQSLVGKCPNAAASMFRLCVDLVTKNLLSDEPEDAAGLNRDVRKYLDKRLTWLFDNKRLPEDLKDLAECIRHDGNDGVHDGTLTMADAEDLFDFTYSLLERIYTEPHKIENAKKRRDERRASK